ncbi:MAG TPA: hypothetical protein VN496_04830 [Burkholderiales bacterium]|jgi:hypothetical protein|nr:hypothetical protein [Burkholderiales bacterium]
MRERSAMLASVTFAFVLIAGLVLQSTLSADAEDCIAKPNAPAPQGEHWYYRIDHANNRQCWRLGPEGLRVQSEGPRAQKSAPQIEKQVAPAAAVQPPVPVRSRRPETTGSSVAAAARAEAAPEPNPASASAASPLRFLDTPRMPDLPPSVQLAPQPEFVGRTQTASAIDTVPAEDNSASSTVNDAPAASSVAEPPRQAAARPSAPPTPATDMEIDHTFAFLMIVFAVLAVAGPTLHYAERRRQREETANYESPRWARVVTPNTPAPRDRVPLQPNLAVDRRPAPIPPTPADQTERLAQALQQLVDRLHTQPRPEPSVTATRPAERTDVEMMRGRRPIALRN